MCLNGLSSSQNAGKWHSESTKFQFSWGGMPPNPPSLVDVNHSCKNLDPPLDLGKECCKIKRHDLTTLVLRLSFHNQDGAVVLSHNSKPEAFHPINKH